MLLKIVLVDKKKSMALWRGAAEPRCPLNPVSEAPPSARGHSAYQGFDETILAQVEHHKQPLSFKTRLSHIIKSFVSGFH